MFYDYRQTSRVYRSSSFGIPLAKLYVMTNDKLISTLLQIPGALASDHNGPYVAGLYPLIYPKLAALVLERRAELKVWMKREVTPKGRG